MANFSIGAINRSKWVLLALVFLIAQVIPIIQFNGTANAADTGTPKTPGATNAPNNWDTNTLGNIQSSNNSYVSDNDGDEQGYTSFNLPAIPAGSTINGVSVNIEAKSSANNGCRVGVALSWNDGSSYTSYKYATLGTSDQSSLLGGSADDWGRTWSITDFTNTNFVLKIQDNDPRTNGQNSDNECTNNATTSVDYLDVKVYYTEPVQPVANPSLATSCGLDIAIVMDNSQSITTAQRTQMKTALTAFTSALSGTPTEFSVVRFGDSSSIIQNFTSNISLVNTAINSMPANPTGQYTNWEAGLNSAYSTFSSDRSAVPDLVLFATDGDPTASSAGSNDTNQPNAHLEPAVISANTIKTSGIRMLALGIGSPTVSRLQAISGPLVDTGDVLTSDVITSNFATLAEDLAEFAEQTCGGTITTTKLIDADGKLNTTNDRTPAADWVFDINGGSNPAATTTNAQGLTPAVKVDAGSGYSVNETQQQGYTLLDASCTGATANGTQDGNAVTGIQIAANNIVSCTFINARANGTITVVKNLDNSDGGTKQKSDFSFTLNGQTYQFEADGTNTVTLPTGTYTVEEVNPNTAGYTTTYSNCTNVVVTENNSPTCTIYNNDNAPSITLNKVVEGPTYGVNPDLNSFGLSVGGNAVTNGATTTVKANQAIAINEQGANGYDWVRIEGNAKCPSVLGGTVTLNLGESISCTIVNKAKAPLITVVKKAVNDNGGTTFSNMFSLYANGNKLADGVTQTNGVTTTTSYSVPNIQANTSYTLSEDKVTGYSATNFVCTGNGTQQGNTISVGLGASATCTIENNDEAPVLTLIKSLNPDLYGSNATGADFTLNATKVGQSVPAVTGEDENAADATSDVTSGSDFQAGTYNLSESSEKYDNSEYSSYGWYCSINGAKEVTVANVTLNIGDKATCTVVNAMTPAEVVVYKKVINDNGGSASADDFSVKLSSDDEYQLFTPMTEDEGGYTGIATFENLNANTDFAVTENTTDGYKITENTCAETFSLKNGEIKECYVTNDDIAPKLTIYKWVDNQESEQEFEFDITKPCKYIDVDLSDLRTLSDSCSFKKTVTVPANGSTDVDGLDAGSYNINEDVPEGWLLGNFSCYENGSDYAINDDEYIYLENGKEYSCYFYNEELSTIQVTKYYDKNENGTRDNYFDQGEEPVLQGFTFNLYTETYNEEYGWGVKLVDSQISDENGLATFKNIPSDYYWIEEQTNDGWRMTDMRCRSDRYPEYDRSSSIATQESDYPTFENGSEVYVNPGNTVECMAGNTKNTHFYDIAKSNNATTAKRVGNTVVYTLTVTIPEDSGVVHSPRVGDAPPTGFAYIPGSWTASSNLRGNLKSGDVATEPTYASPGIWNFNGPDQFFDPADTIPNNAFYPGEVITLTYQTKINNDVSPGTYPDVALSLAYSSAEVQTPETAVLANVTNQDGTTPFVGTDVEVVTDPVTPETLVNTGSNALVALLFGSALILAGFGTRRIVAKERRMN